MVELNNNSTRASIKRRYEIMFAQFVFATNNINCVKKKSEKSKNLCTQHTPNFLFVTKYYYLVDRFFTLEYRNVTYHTMWLCPFLKSI